jgi:hypothetical protein
MDPGLIKAILGFENILFHQKRHTDMALNMFHMDHTGHIAFPKTKKRITGPVREGVPAAYAITAILRLE